ncbi:MAG: hypothetical protein SGI90_00530 [Candidatus Eisenbacteria bacterium]|nr:hypothetical protein [Candidatus Eisenbacteria bacterium]
MTEVLLYLAVFGAALAVDLIPFFGPPAWMAMVFFMVKFDLNPWLVLMVGVTGSTLGRYLLSRYIPKISDRLIKPQKNADLKFLGGKLRQSLWRSWGFVFIYSLLPMSTTTLFTAAGIARIAPLVIIPPFFLGKLVSDAVMLFTGSYAAINVDGVIAALFSPKSLLLTVPGVAAIALMLFLDWRLMLAERKLAFNFRIWK